MRESPEFSDGEAIARRETETPVELGLMRKQLICAAEVRPAEEKGREVSSALELVSSCVEKYGQRAWNEGIDWLDGNNHRINLYQVAGQAGEWEAGEMTPEKAEQFRLIKLAEICLKTLADSPDAEGAARELSSNVDRLRSEPYLCRTALDSLARVDAEAADDKLAAVAADESWPYDLRCRAACAALRNGKPLPEEIAVSLLAKGIDDIDYQAIELAGLLGGERGARALEEMNARLAERPVSGRLWWQRDILSTHLDASGGRSDLLGTVVGENSWTSAQGIVFGSIEGFDGFGEWADRNRDRLEAVAAAVDRVNCAFGGEPVRYVDITPQRIDGDGWTQNSIYLGKWTLEHPSLTPEDCAQSAGHEACERWESKGFVDADLERLYLELMGDNYEGSQLDNFRLNRRMSLPTRAGHPWDGTREFIAELGSTMLVDSSAVTNLFDPESDKPALGAIRTLKEKFLAIVSAKQATGNRRQKSSFFRGSNMV
jgi:hypothetical protein